MERTYIRSLRMGEKQKIQGFLERVRDTKRMAFLIVRDISGKIQVTVDKASHPERAEALKQLTLESAVTVVGNVFENPGVQLGGIELIPEEIRAESLAEPLPIGPDASPDLRMDYRWLDLRAGKQQLLFQIQTLLVAEMRRFLLDRGFLEIHTPKLTGTASESGAEVFEVKYFDKRAYLAQSPQFYKQMAMAGGLERVFEVGPVFRAEKSHTNRHATEFTGFDVEFSWIEDYRDVMALEEALVAHAMQKVRDTYAKDIKRIYGVEIEVPSRPFPTIALRDLYRELEERYGYIAGESEKGDMTTQAERLSRRFSQDVFGHDFLFVTDFCAQNRAFYHMRKDGVPQGYDLFWKGVEITTGAQREHRYTLLKAQAEQKGLSEDVRFYLEFFRYGCPPHGGFGLGVDRLTMLLLEAPLREAMFLFRGPDRLTP